MNLRQKLRGLEIALVIFLFSCKLLANEKTDPAFTFDCINHHYRVYLNKERELAFESTSQKPLFPRLDRRIHKITIGPMPCAQTMGPSVVCYTDVCRYEKYYDAQGNELSDVKPNGDVLFTALPEKIEVPERGDFSQRLNLRLEFNNWYDATKHFVEESFEMYPGKFCEFGGPSKTQSP